MKEKYIEEAFPRFMIFGGNEDTGPVDIVTANEDLWDVLTSIDLNEAKRLIEDRDRLVNALIYAINAHGEDRDYEVFKKVAYGE